MKKLASILLCFFTIVILVACNSSNKIIKNEHSDQWTADLEFVKEELPKRAKGFYEFITEDAWNESIDTLINDINTRIMIDEEINYRILEILTKVKNGHTSFKSGYDFEVNSFPFALWGTSNKEYYVLATSKEYEKYLGAKLVSINEFTINEVIKKLQTITPHDNTLQIDALLENSFLDENKLKYLGITKNDNKFTFKMPNGKIETIKIVPTSLNSESTIVHISQLYKNKPIKFQRPDNMLYEYWYTIDKNNNAFYFQYNNCEDKGSNPNKPYLPEFNQFASEMIDYMKENDKNFDTIVIDLRKNSGGNAGLFKDLITKNLEYLNQKEIKVLLDKSTYSSGVAAINTLYDKLDVKSYGTETGGLIGGYTDSGQLYLKHTGSFIYFSKAETGYDALQKRQLNEFEGFIPDVIIEDTVEDFRDGIDKVYEKAILN